MKRLWLMLIGIAFVMICANVQAQEKAPLGNGNLAVKLDYIAFTDDFFKNPPDEDLDAEDASAYVGLEGYGKIAPDLYFGGEIGYSALDLGRWHLFFDHRDLVIDIMFTELNLKYAKDLGHNFVVDVGAGLSYDKATVTFEKHEWIGGTHTVTESREETDWLLGGQIFADLTYKIRWFSIGINGKYQVTEAFHDATTGYDFDLTNWRLGMQIGIVF